MGVVAIEDVLLPGIDVRVTAVHTATEAVHTATERVVVEAAACGRPPDCPNCGCRGRRVHSRYRRRLTERPVAGRSLVISLQVRRFFCERAECRWVTFVEQVPDLSEGPVATASACGSGCGTSRHSSAGAPVNDCARPCSS
ncbi:transposase family protein, partial [Streptomyces sp. NPDC060223]|uniref:transposase family protein n=1 Tax=Streptomyces sp. NPDC060223 TaxID=3347077 RepID=UPI00364CE965